MVTKAPCGHLMKRWLRELRNQQLNSSATPKLEVETSGKPRMLIRSIGSRLSGLRDSKKQGSLQVRPTRSLLRASLKASRKWLGCIPNAEFHILTTPS